MVTSFFDAVELVPEDPILGLAPLFAKDPRNEKVNLGIGSYKTAEGKSFLLQTVSEAEDRLAIEKLSKDYLPMEGDPLFLEKMVELALGRNDPELFYAVQGIGGTCSLRLAAQFLKNSSIPTIAIPNPSWVNHHLIFTSVGLQVETYTYYDQKNHQIDIKGMLLALEKLPSGSAVLLQAACHNPTGADLNHEQWHKILEVFQKRDLLAFFDNAYQGFAKSLEEDVYPIRLFDQNNREMLIASSCSKNFGLYAERVGALIFRMNHSTSRPLISSQIKKIIRSIYSSPPAHGARIVAHILNDIGLRACWKEELNAMRTRIQNMRQVFAARLAVRRGDNAFQFLAEEYGFFSLLGIDEETVMKLRDKKAIYLPSSGRINIAGLTPSNIDYVIEALAQI